MTEAENNIESRASNKAELVNSLTNTLHTLVF